MELGLLSIKQAGSLPIVTMTVGDYIPMSSWSDRPVEQRLRYYEKMRQKAAEKAAAEGREPGRVGRPPVLSPEEKEASRIKQNRRRTLATAARIKAKRAAKALAEGREPGKVGQPRQLTDEQRRINRLETYAKHKAENIEAIREKDATRYRKLRAAKALAEGRVPGMIGRLSSFTAEEIEEYKAKWADKEKVYYFRVKAQNSRAIKLGVPGEITVADMRDVAIEQRDCCAYCGKPFAGQTPEIDHWKPMARGGHNTKDNIRLLHRACNRTKGARLIDTLLVNSR